MLTAALAALGCGLTSAAAAACPAPPAAVRDLDIPRYYSDPAGTIVDPSLKARYDAATAPLIAFLREVTAQADAAVKSAKADKRAASARCAVGWLAAWAREGAWLGQRITQQGEYQRKWDLGGVALAYLKVQQAATPAERSAIEAWLKEVADRARAFFDNPQRKRNNHWYWLGVGLGGVALATGDDRYWQMARAIAVDAARDIRSDGALVMELERGQRALHYHAFSVMPLVVLAELAAARGEDFYALEKGALHRLVEVTLRGLDDPATFERLAGVGQVTSPSTPGAGWLQLYRARFPARTGAPMIAMRPSDRRLGGDIEALMRHLAARQQPDAGSPFRRH